MSSSLVPAKCQPNWHGSAIGTFADKSHFSWSAVFGSAGNEAHGRMWRRMGSKGQRAAEFFALKRNTSVLLLALVLAGTGERLWLGFAPKYLLVLGAAPF